MTEVSAQLNVTIPLEQPLQRGETTIKQLTVRKPNAGGLRGLNMASLVQMDINTLITLLPRITEPALTEAEVANLATEDLMQLGAEVAGFFMSASTKQAYLIT